MLIAGHMFRQGIGTEVKKDGLLHHVFEFVGSMETEFAGVGVVREGHFEKTLAKMSEYRVCVSVEDSVFRESVSFISDRLPCRIVLVGSGDFVLNVRSVSLKHCPFFFSPLDSASTALFKLFQFKYNQRACFLGRLAFFLD